MRDAVLGSWARTGLAAAIIVLILGGVLALAATGQLGDLRLHERTHATPAHRPAGDRADLHRHGGLLARPQGPDCARLAAVCRQVLEQVAQCLDAERPQRLGRLRARDRDGQCQA